jgi:tetratricopeptide (TPR) repeat protein
VPVSRVPLVSGLLLLSISVYVWGDSRAALRKAADLVQQGHLEEADEQAQLALSDPSTRAVACSVLGTIRLQQQRLPESVKFLEEAIRLEPRLLGAHLTLADAYTLQGKTERAVAVYRQVLKMDSSNVQARVVLARYEADRGNYRASMDLALPVDTELKHSPDGLHVLAEDYLNTNDRAAAAALAKDWTQLSGVPEEWSIKFALLLGRAGVVPEAITVLEHAKQSSDESYALSFNLASLYLLNSDPKRALDNYDQALALEPKSLPALRQAGIVAEKQGELERSLSYWLRAKKLAPDDPEILLDFGRVCLKMDLLEDAEPALTKAASLRPDDPAYQYTLASANVGKKQFDAAQSILEKLLQKNPQDAQVQYALGSILYLKGHLTEAKTYLSESVRLQPQQVASYYYLALIARDQGRDTEAIERLETLLQRYPDHASSCELLGELLMSAHKYPEAENNLQKAVRLNPTSVKANYQLGLLLSRMGKKSEANRQLEIAKSLRTQDEATSRLQLRLLDPDQ